MSTSESDRSSSSGNSPLEDSGSENNEIESEFLPYVDDPVADDEWSGGEDCEDVDGLQPIILERRYDGRDIVQTWCQCQCCNTDNLDSALEYRCCREIDPVLNLLVFEGREEMCITKHPDFIPMTNKTVLKNAAPLFKDRQGKRYRRLDGRSENELLRATAYRWLARWICGYLGWDNARPLSACIYHYVRTNIHSHNVTGYASSRQRDI